MRTRVVDTNVAVVANGRAPQASAECVSACARALGEFESGRSRLVLDDEWWILREYQNNLRSAGQPGPGDAFFKWVLTNQANPRRCERVRITALHSDGSDFAEFPRDAALAAFDPADRKFVAVSRAHAARPPIAQAVDSKWWRLRSALERCAVAVEFLCPDDIRALAEKDHPTSA